MESCRNKGCPFLNNIINEGCILTVEDFSDYWGSTDCPLYTATPTVSIPEAELAELRKDMDKAVELLREVSTAFEPMVTAWKEGRCVTKLCYGLNNFHMEELVKLEAYLKEIGHE